MDGALVIVVTIGGVYFLFRKYGRVDYGEEVIVLTDLTKIWELYSSRSYLLVGRERRDFRFVCPNGAGKSTTILMMLGLTDLLRAAVSICGIDATKRPIEVKEKSDICPKMLVSMMI